MSTTTETVWTPEAIRALGARTSVETASEVLGISRGYGYQLIREDNFPVKVVKIGKRNIVPTAGILEVLDVEASGPLTAAFYG